MQPSTFSQWPLFTSVQCIYTSTLEGSSIASVLCLGLNESYCMNREPMGRLNGLHLYSAFLVSLIICSTLHYKSAFIHNITHRYSYTGWRGYLVGCHLLLSCNHSLMRSQIVGEVVGATRYLAFSPRTLWHVDRRGRECTNGHFLITGQPLWQLIHSCPGVVNFF